MTASESACVTTALEYRPTGLERIFAMFSQLERPETTVSGGLGIGLALSRTLVGLHGGTLQASSDGPGTGATFEIELPFVPSVSARAPVPIATHQLAEQRIVVADDNVDSAESLAALLTLSGHNVFIANDGVAAVRLARALRPTIVVLDLGMPIMDGYEAARQIRADTGGADPVLVALSGFGQAGDRERSKTGGVRPAPDQASRSGRDRIAAFPGDCQPFCSRPRERGPPRKPRAGSALAGMRIAGIGYRACTSGAASLSKELFDESESIERPGLQQVRQEPAGQAAREAT